jgi:hypothetical protein
MKLQPFKPPMTGTSQATAIAAAVVDDDLPEVKGSKLPPVAGRKKVVYRNIHGIAWWILFVIYVYIYISIYIQYTIYIIYILSVIYPCNAIYIYMYKEEAIQI